MADLTDRPGFSMLASIAAWLYEGIDKLPAANGLMEVAAVERLGEVALVRLRAAAKAVEDQLVASAPSNEQEAIRELMRPWREQVAAEGEDSLRAMIAKLRAGAYDDGI